MKFADGQNLTLGRTKKYATESPWVAILGNPNCGKTALFNLLTGMHQKVGNYPGITVEKKSGVLKGHSLVVRDLPGAYSLDAKSLDEQVVANMVQSWRKPENRPRAVILVLDATNLGRSNYLALQVLEFGLPTIIALNMIDEARTRGIEIDTDKLQKALGAYRIIKTSAKTGEGVDELVRVLTSIELSDMVVQAQARIVLSETVRRQLRPLEERLAALNHKLHLPPLVDALRLATDKSYDKYIRAQLDQDDWNGVEKIRTGIANKIADGSAAESRGRYQLIDEILEKTVTLKKSASVKRQLDSLLLHPFYGFVALLVVLGTVFNAIFEWMKWPMDQIEAGVARLSQTLSELLPAGAVNSLVSDGIVPGVGNVLVFLPQIMLLTFFIALLEDSGYMARIAFLMDKTLRRLGLQGKAVLPMLSGFACAIPAVMAARTIENRRDRLITIMLIPLMSCSARLPVYTLLISAFVPQTRLLGFLPLQTMVFLAVYFLGLAAAVLISSLIKKFSPQEAQSHFIMELPPYRLPMLRSLFWSVYNSSKLFLVNAGSIILILSVVIWGLASYPKAPDAENLTPRQQVEQSYAGRLGHAIEPAIAPLGFDWKIGVGLVSSFAAREVIVSSMATIYNLESDVTEESPSLRDALRNDRRPDGTPVYSGLTAISLLVFFVFAAQCMSTLAVVRRETNSWKWPALMLVYMTGLAWVASFAVYQGGRLVGLG